MKETHTGILQAFSPLIASFTIGIFLLSSCSNISVDSDGDTENITNQTAEDGTGTSDTKFLDESGIEFTGNPAYDIWLLNEWWAKNGTPFPAPQEENSTFHTNSSARVADGEVAQVAINGFGDMISNFSGASFLTWIGGAALGGAISTGGSVAAGMLLDALGIQKTQTHYFKEIIGKLKRMEGQLASIQNTLNDMHKNVEKLKKEVGHQSELTQYYEVMQQRDSDYNDIFTDAFSCWNSIFDEIVQAALISQYGNKTAAYNAKLAEIEVKSDWRKTMTLRIDYLDKFIDTGSWLKAKKADEVSFKSTEAAEAFQTYCSKHSAEIGKKLNERILEWGKKSSTGAQAVKRICYYLTHGIPSTTGEEHNMFQLYDKYAELNFLWEKEGYTLRQQLRDQDSALIALTAPLAYWYYGIESPLGTNSLNCIELTDYVNSAIKLNTDNPVIKSDGPVYQKWGSKWKNQKFSSVLKKIDYGTVIKNEWQTSKMEWKEAAANLPTYTAFWEESFNCWVYSRNFDLNAYNCSRLYAGLGRKELSTSGAFTMPCSEAENLAMDEEWYKEMIDAYTVVNSNSDMTLPINPIPNVTLLKIFENAGFTLENGLPPSKANIKNKENYFITKYGITADVSWDIWLFEEPQFIVSIPAVHADTTKDIIVDREKRVDGLGLSNRKHYADAVRCGGLPQEIINGEKRYAPETDFKICEEVLKIYDRGFYTPVKQ